MNIPLTHLTPPTQREGDYLDTLDQWGALPQYLPLPDAARLIGRRCSQNPAAILKVLERAVVAHEIPFAGLSGSGTWEPGMLRILQPLNGKARMRLSDAALTINAVLAAGGRLHSEAVGVTVADAVGLLVKRGRKVPDELRHLLPAEPVEAPTPRHAEHPKGVSRAEIIAGFRLPAEWGERLRKATSGKYRELAGTWTRKGRRGGDPTLYSPARIGLALTRHIENGRPLRNVKAVQTVLEHHWPDWLEEWAELCPSDD